MSVMGVDPGIANTGIAQIYDSEGTECFLAGEMINTYAWQETRDRIGHIANKVGQFVLEMRPAYMFVEEVFFSKNKSSAMTTSMVIGACAHVAYIHNIKFYLIRPNEMKKLLTGRAKADKIKVEEAVRNKVLHVDDDLSNHVVDAVGIALAGCYKIDKDLI